MSGKRKESLTGLVCPKCGRRLLGVYNTNSFDTCVIRKRMCGCCGYEMETIEVGRDGDVVMRSIFQYILDSLKKGSLKLPEPEIRKPILGVDA